MSGGRQPLEIFVPFMGKRNASLFYRIERPLEALLTETALPTNVLIDDGLISTKNELRAMIWSYADIVLTWNPVSKQLIENMLLMREWKPGLNNAGNVQWPPSYVITTDDAMFDVQPYNPAFKDLGYKHPNGQFVGPDEKVYVQMPDEDEPRAVYQDGKKGFNAAKNREVCNTLKQLYLLADEVIVSTPELAAYMKDNIGRECVVIPNCVSLHDLQPLPLIPNKDPVILWQGSSTHVEDIWEVEDALARVMAKYPKVKFIAWGTLTASMMKKLPMDRVTALPYRPFQEYGYYQQLRALNYDISIAPLSKTEFAACRSGIKWYEAGALGKPTLAANHGPYKEITDGETGLLYNSPEEFEEKLCRLIEDAELRSRLGGAAREWVKENRDPVKWAEKYYEVFQKCRERMRASKPYEVKDGITTDLSK